MPYFTSYDGTRLWYDTEGAGEPLVCLPGGPGVDVRVFGDLGGLAGHRRLILADPRALDDPDRFRTTVLDFLGA